MFAPARRWFACAALGATLTLACRRTPHAGSHARDSRTAEAAAPVARDPLASVPRSAWSAPDRAAALAQGRDAIVRQECNRCHEIDDIPPASRPMHCISCHQFLQSLQPGSRQWATITSRYGEDVLRRYQRNIVHYTRTPSLTRIAQRLRPSWIARYIAAPHDLRPAMHETMVRTNLPPADLHAIVRYFAAIAEVADPGPVVAAPPAAPAGSGVALHASTSPTAIAEGRGIFESRGCTTCHTLGNVATGRTAADLERLGLPAALAPNLRFVRERMHPEVVVDWLLAPHAFVEGTLMPPSGLTRDQAAHVRDYLYSADPGLQPEPGPIAARAPPPATQPVAWEDVKERVLGFVCVHCHMNDHERDRGPGNMGGFSWPGSRLAMRTYESLVAGAVDSNGQRYSVLVPRDGQSLPPLVLSLLRRRDEERRDHVAAFGDHALPAFPNAPPGMPMGLPSITDENISLLLGWIAQGCPGPTRVTGMPGIRDGYLVPDGPIERNRGCELRAPSTRRPAWSTQPPPPWDREREREQPASPRPATP